LGQETRVSRLKYVFNYRDWIKDYIRSPSHHTEPHAYKFEINQKGDVGVWFKRFCMDPEWKELGTVLPHMPDGTPSLVRFDWAKQCTLKEMEDKLKSCEVKFSRREIDWWGKFLEDWQRLQT